VRSSIDVIDSVAEYAALLREVFDFPAIARLLQRPTLRLRLTASAASPARTRSASSSSELGAPASSLANCDPKEDFGGHHPDPNLTYAEELVKLMRAGAFDFGAACDGDADRNMVLGKRFFVNPCDSVAIIAAHARRLPFYASQLRAVARSMPTSEALDRVARDIGVEMYEVPTGWKYFGNIMDHHERHGAPNGVICGEESFGTGSSHVREKDGVWAVLAWLSIVALHNPDAAAPLVSVEQHCHGALAQVRPQLLLALRLRGRVERERRQGDGAARRRQIAPPQARHRARARLQAARRRRLPVQRSV
jgi:phosphoglucomutase